MGMRIAIPLVVLALAGSLEGQQRDSIPEYRGFFPGMSLPRFREVAEGLSLTIECTVEGEQRSRCQSPNAEQIIRDDQPVTQLAVVAGLDSSRTRIQYLVILEPDTTELRPLLFGLLAKWGQPGRNSAETATWDTNGYRMALGTAHGHRGVILGFNRRVGRDSTLTVGEVDQPPRIMACGALHFTPEMQARGLSGKVVLQFVVRETGEVDIGSIHVITTDHAMYSEEATRFIQTCSFRPGDYDGQPVRVLVQQTINFALN